MAVMTWRNAICASSRLSADLQAHVVKNIPRLLANVRKGQLSPEDCQLVKNLPNPALAKQDIANIRGFAMLAIALEIPSGVGISLLVNTLKEA